MFVCRADVTSPVQQQQQQQQLSFDMGQSNNIDDSNHKPSEQVGYI